MSQRGIDLSLAPYDPKTFNDDRRWTILGLFAKKDGCNRGNNLMTMKASINDLSSIIWSNFGPILEENTLSIRNWINFNHKKNPSTSC